jgi:hypothetical protein
MEIKMQIVVPLAELPAVVKFFEKHSVAMKSSEFTNGEAGRKKKVFLSEAQKGEIAKIKDRARGRAGAVAAQYGVSVSVIRRIWSS